MTVPASPPGDAASESRPIQVWTRRDAESAATPPSLSRQRDGERRRDRERVSASGRALARLCACSREGGGWASARSWGSGCRRRWARRRRGRCARRRRTCGRLGSSRISGPRDAQEPAAPVPRPAFARPRAHAKTGYGAQRARECKGRGARLRALSM